MSNKFIEAPNSEIRDVSKQKARPFLYLRISDSFLNDIKTISAITGLTMNAACLDILRPAIKNKLKELNDI